MCTEDLFGEASEEKEVQEIRRHLVEAKANKTNDTFAILGKLLSPAALSLVLEPLKKVC